MSDYHDNVCAYRIEQDEEMERRLNEKLQEKPITANKDDKNCVIQ